MLTTIEKAAKLKQVPFFELVAGIDLGRIALVTTEHQMLRGEILLNQYDAAFILILGGQLSSDQLTQLKSAKKVFNTPAGTVLLPSALFVDDRLDAPITLKSDLRFLRIEKKEFDRLVSQNPDLAVGLLNFFAAYYFKLN